MATTKPNETIELAAAQVGPDILRVTLQRGHEGRTKGVWQVSLGYWWTNAEGDLVPAMVRGRWRGFRLGDVRYLAPLLRLIAGAAGAAVGREILSPLELSEALNDAQSVSKLD